MTGCEILRAAEQLNYTYEGEPPQVKEYCLPILRLPPIIFVRVVLIRFPIPPVVLTSEPVSITLDIREHRQRLAVIAESKKETLFLELDDVEAERQPGVAWQVYVGLPGKGVPDPESPYYVGNVALFGTGIRSEAPHEFKPARFEFAINRALQASLKASGDRIEVTFVPQGILIDGKTSRPKADSTVRIGRVSLTVETEKHQEEQPKAKGFDPASAGRRRA